MPKELSSGSILPEWPLKMALLANTNTQIMPNNILREQIILEGSNWSKFDENPQKIVF